MKFSQSNIDTITVQDDDVLISASAENTGMFGRTEGLPRWEVEPFSLQVHAKYPVADGIENAIAAGIVDTLSKLGAAFCGRFPEAAGRETVAS